MYSNDQLLLMLASNFPSERFEACKWLRSSQESSPEIITALMQLTHDPDHRVARWAKLALQAEAHRQMATKMELDIPADSDNETDQPEISPPAKNLCPYCGTINPHSARFCNICGKTLPGMDTLALATTQFPVRAPGSYVAPRQKSHKVLYIILGSIGAVIALTLIFFTLAYKNVNNEVQPISSVLNSFMKNLAAQDVQSAYALTGPEFRQQIPISTISPLISGENYRLVDGYEGLTITNIHITYGSQKIAEVVATTTYESGTGQLTATLKKVNGQWMIFGFNFKKYLAP